MSSEYCSTVKSINKLFQTINGFIYSSPDVGWNNATENDQRPSLRAEKKVVYGD